MKIQLVPKILLKTIQTTFCFFVNKFEQASNISCLWRQRETEMKDDESFSDTWHGNNYDRRSKSKNMRKESALQIIEHLEALWEKSDPSKGRESEKHKDRVSLEALQLVGKFCDLMAGWAIDHAIGTALNDLELPALFMDSTEKLQIELNQSSIHDKHELESQGRKLSWQHGPPPQISDDYYKVVRHTLLALIESRSTGLPRDMALILAQAIRAVNYGSTPKIFDVSQAPDSKKNYMQLDAQLKALEHIAFRIANGSKKQEAEKHVAKVYRITEHAIRKWAPKVISELGESRYKTRLQHARDLSFAHRHEFQPADYGTAYDAEIEYGQKTLERDSEAYNQLSRDKKLARERRRVRPTGKE